MAVPERVAMAGDRDWSSLPVDLIDLVSSLVASERDLLHIRQVCAHWRASVTPRLAAPFRPWVVASRRHANRVESIGEYSLWLPHGVRRVQVSGPPDLSYCCGTPRGWLALANDDKSPTQLVLWEPRSGTRIVLPPLARLIQVFLSADPLDSSDWMAVASQNKYPPDETILFWRPGDVAWSATAQPEPLAYFKTHNVAFHDRKMYCIDFTKRITVYDLGEVGTAACPTLMLPQGMSLHPLNSRAAHFVTCMEDLLLVLLFHGHEPSSPEVYRLRPQDLTPEQLHLDLRKSERVKDLGGYSLFLGRGDAFALSAEEHPAIRRNCIYYVEHFRMMQKKRHWAFVFDLESEDVEEIPIPPAEHMENRQRQWWPSSWFCPRKPILSKQY